MSLPQVPALLPAHVPRNFPASTESLAADRLTISLENDRSSNATIQSVCMSAFSSIAVVSTDCICLSEIEVFRGL
jgi:hypothetical protein